MEPKISANQFLNAVFVHHLSPAQRRLIVVSGLVTSGHELLLLSWWHSRSMGDHLPIIMQTDPPR